MHQTWPLHHRSSRMMDTLLLLALNGLVWGLIIALIALGLSVIFGLLDIINIAHGDFFMVGTVLAWASLEATGNFWIGFIVVPLICLLLGALIQVVVIQPIRGVAALSIVATFGLSLILQEVVRMTFGATPRRILPPISGTVPLFGIEYEIYRLFAAMLSLAALAAFFIFLQHTKLGTWMRAVRHDRDTAIAMGIPAQRVYMVTFAIGFALAGFGGIVAAPITTVDFRGGVDLLPVCFIAVIIGGLGNLPGTAAAAILLSLLEGIIQSVANPTIARISSLVNTFWVSVIAEILIWSLFAASVNLLFGYVGLLSFGQALFFGFGMYGVGIGIDQLHLSFWPAFGLGISAAMLMALVSGIFAVRLTWHYFAIITVVFSLIFYFLAVTMQPLTGGDDGINFTLPPTFTWGGTQWSFTDATFQYFFILAAVSVCFYLMHLVIRSPLGKAFLAIRDNDVRASLIGLNVYLLRLTAFVMAGFLAGVAGALFAFFGRYASASYMFYHVSGEAVVWAIVGGAGTLFGPIVGTTLFIVIRELVSTHWEHHALIVGVMAILVVILAPKGLVGLWNEGLARWCARAEGTSARTNLQTEP